MNEPSSFSGWQPDPAARKKGLALSLLVHVVIVVALSFASFGIASSSGDVAEPSLTVIDLSGPRTPRPPQEKLAISEPRSVISKTSPIRSDAPVSVMAVPEGGSGGDGLIWTPPQPDYGYGGGVTISSSAPLYVEVPAPLVFVPGKDLEPSFIRFDGTRLVDTAREFAKLGPDIKVMLVAELPVDVDGKPLGCEIVEGHVSSEIDVLGCHLLMGNFYHPARNSAGEAVVGFAKALLSWDGQRFSILEGRRELFINSEGQVELIEKDESEDVIGVVDDVISSGLIDPSR